jgi:hypothetical protein
VLAGGTGTRLYHGDACREQATAECLEEIAFRQGFIDVAQLERLAEPLKQNDYGQYLLRLLHDREHTGQSACGHWSERAGPPIGVRRFAGGQHALHADDGTEAACDILTEASRQSDDLNIDLHRVRIEDVAVPASRHQAALGELLEHACYRPGIRYHIDREAEN